MRRALAVGVAGVALVAPGAARAEGESVSLSVGRSIVLHGTTVRFSGRVEPATEDIRVHLYRRIDGTDYVVARLRTRADGTYGTRLRLSRPGPFLARAGVPVEGGEPVLVESALARLRIKPRLKARVTGTAVVGHRLFLRGRLRPAAAGVLTRKMRGEVRRVRVGEHGAFKLRLRTKSAHPVWVRLRLHPDAGYTARWKTKKRKLALPYLGMGSNGPSVRALERLLNQRQYALRGVGAYYGDDRAGGARVPKGARPSRTGRTTPDVWRRLTLEDSEGARPEGQPHRDLEDASGHLRGAQGQGRERDPHLDGSDREHAGRQMAGLQQGAGLQRLAHVLLALLPPRLRDPRLPLRTALAGEPRLLADPALDRAGLYSRWGYGSRIIVFP